jgi:hypothetical protein
LPFLRLTCHIESVEGRSLVPPYWLLQLRDEYRPETFPFLPERFPTFPFASQRFHPTPETFPYVSERFHSLSVVVLYGTKSRQNSFRRRPKRFPLFPNISAERFPTFPHVSIGMCYTPPIWHISRLRRRKMGTSEQATTEFKITAACTITDPAERQRRLAQVYQLITEFAREKRLAAKAEPIGTGQSEA